MSRFSPDDFTDERALMERVRAGDEVAFREVYLGLYSPLREFAFALTRDDGAAHDITQEVLFAFWQNRERIEVRERFIPYLYKGIRNKAANVRRHDNAVRETEDLYTPDDPAPGMSAAELPIDTELEARETIAALKAAIENLPDRQRAVLTLYTTRGLTTPEIASILGVSPEAVLMALSRARNTLRNTLGSSQR